MRQALRCALAVLLWVSAAATPAAQDGPPALTVAPITFDGTTFHHRWNANGQYEFTPAGQEDLGNWIEMVTVWVYPTIADGDALARQANGVLGQYEQSGGQIIRTNSTPRTAAKPAEHFIAGLLQAKLDDRHVAEFVATRFVMVDCHGAAIVYSRRAYGDDAPRQVGQWIAANGQRVENALMAWDPSRTVPALQSRGL